MSRRGFLEAAGFTISAAAVSGCGRPEPERSLPFAIQPEGVIPGRMKHYASTCGGCSAGCGLLVGTRDGRPLKMEGLAERDGLQAHPLSQGGLCAIGQALPLGLYDSQRLAQPEKGGEQASWDEVDKAINEQLKHIKGGQRAVRVVTGSVTSPTLKATIDAFLADFDDGWHVTLDSVSSSAVLDAHAKTHGARVLPHYKFDQAQTFSAPGFPPSSSRRPGVLGVCRPKNTVRCRITSSSKGACRSPVPTPTCGTASLRANTERH